MSIETEQLLQTASEAAKKSGGYLLENLNKINPEEVDEKAKNDFVTFVDKTSEKIIIDHIRERYPGHSFLAEENGQPKAVRGDYMWIIDPLDGTSNYIHGIPSFCISIAVKHKNHIVAGVVYDPLHNELFQAQGGKGAFLNGNPIHISNGGKMERAILATGFPHRKKQILPAYLLAFQEIFLKCSGVRRCGSAALDLCYTACNRYGGFWELGLSPWDVAAGSLMVQEAGGKVSDFRGEPNYMENGLIIAGNNIIHSVLKNILSYHFKDPMPNKN